MSEEYAGRSNEEIAQSAEADLNRQQMKQGNAGASDSARDSGVNEAGAERFPGGSVTIGSAASGGGNNRDIPPEEGGSIDARGRTSKAGDFEGEGGPEEKAQRHAEDNPGADDVRENVRNDSQGSRLS